MRATAVNERWPSDSQTKFWMPLTALDLQLNVEKTPTGWQRPTKLLPTTGGSKRRAVTPNATETGTLDIERAHQSTPPSPCTNPAPLTPERPRQNFHATQSTA